MRACQREAYCCGVMLGISSSMTFSDAVKSPTTTTTLVIKNNNNTSSSSIATAFPKTPKSVEISPSDLRTKKLQELHELQALLEQSV